MYWTFLILACSDATKDTIIDAEQDTGHPTGGAASDQADSGSQPSNHNEDTGSDTGLGDPILEGGVAFWEADLVPPFQHGNAAWSGVALLDYDADGWLDMYMTNGQSQPNSLYRNQGNGRFIDMAVAAGVNFSDRMGPVTSGDIDNDGDPDLVVGIECSLGTLGTDGFSLGDGGLAVLLNLGDGTFLRNEVELPMEVAERGMCPISLELGDINGDGFLDLASNNGNDPDQVYPWKYGIMTPEAIDLILLGDGSGSFTTEVEIIEGIRDPDPLEGRSSMEQCVDGCSSTTFVSAFLDVNEDGRLDRISGEGGRPLQVFLQNSDGSLERDDSRVSAGMGQWMGLAIADFDGDGDMDIYSTNQGLSPLIAGYDNIPRAEGIAWANPFHNVFVRNDDQTYTERHDWPTEITVPQGVDRLIPDFFGPDRGTFGHWFPLEGLRRLPWGWGAVSLDANLDGWPDVAFTGNNCSAPMAIIWDENRGAGPGGLLLNQNGEGFYDAIHDWEISNVDNEGRYQDGRGIATGDLNNDGVPDLVFMNRSYNPTQSDPLAQEYGVPHVWLSKPREGNWLRVDLEGTTSNRDAIGSVVSVDLGGRTVKSILGAGGATNSASERTLLFGTGEATSVDILVTFPSGVTTTVEGVAVNQSISVVEP